MRRLKVLISSTIAIAFFLESVACPAGELSRQLLLQEGNVGAGVSEYVYRNRSDEVLMPVYLLGAVGKPGVYHLPVNTDLTTLFALAGGPSDRAEIHRVILKRKNPAGDFTTSTIDFDKLSSSSHDAAPQLQGNDVIWVNHRPAAVSQDTVLIVSLISGLVGIALSGVLIYKTTK